MPQIGKVRRTIIKSNGMRKSAITANSSRGLSSQQKPGPIGHARPRNPEMFHRKPVASPAGPKHDTEDLTGSDGDDYDEAEAAKQEHQKCYTETACGSGEESSDEEDVWTQNTPLRCKKPLNMPSRRSL